MRESVEFNGRMYHRYPNAKQSNHRHYYTSHDAWRATPRMVHRDIWKFHNGEIPEGHHIHHADKNFNNNEISNLVCLSSAAHNVEHREERSARAKSPEHLAHLDSIRHLANQWHKTEECRAWAREHAKKSLLKDRPEKPCIICGTMFKPKIAKASMCSRECKRIRTNQQQSERYYSRLRSNGGA